MSDEQARPARRTRLATAVLLLAVSAAGLGTSAAPLTTVPAAVQRWFDSSGTALAHSIDESKFADGDALQLGSVHQVSRFSNAFTSGQDGTLLINQPEWIAPARDQGRAIGTVSTTLAQGAVEPSTGSVSTDTLLAQELTRSTGAIVEDERTGAWYQVDGTQISALNARARDVLPSPQALTVFQRSYAANQAAQKAASEGMPDAVGGSAGVAVDGTQGQYGLPLTWLIAIIAGGVLLAASAVTLLVRAARRPGPLERPIRAGRF